MFLCPQAKFHFEGEPAETGWTYDNLVWDDLFFPKPTLEELQIAHKYSMISNDYRLERLKHYPTADQQLAIIFDKGIEGWKECIQNVKNAIPKPTLPE